MEKGKEVVTAVEMPSVMQKLAMIQRELFCPKGQKNEFGKYNYRSCEDILRAVKPLLEKHGCVIYIDCGVKQVSAWIYATARVTLVNCESETHESITVEAQAREPESRKGMDAAQVTGSSISYARKYALAGLFAIDNEKDPDATNDEVQKQTVKTPTVIKPAAATVAAKVTPLDFNVCPCGKVKGKKWAELPTDVLNKIIQTPREKVPSLTDKHFEALEKEIWVRADQEKAAKAAQVKDL